jgi:hypothetical protein
MELSMRSFYLDRFSWIVALFGLLASSLLVSSVQADKPPKQRTITPVIATLQKQLKGEWKLIQDNSHYDPTTMEITPEKNNGGKIRCWSKGGALFIRSSYVILSPGRIKLLKEGQIYTYNIQKDVMTWSIPDGPPSIRFKRLVSSTHR